MVQFNVVIADGAAGGGGGDGGVAGAAQRHREGFIELHAGVTADIDCDCLAGFSCGEVDDAGGEQSTAEISRIGWIGAGTADGPGSGGGATGAAREGDGEGEGLGAGIAF